MNNEMQKDLVLSINEFAYVLDETKGHVVCWVGPAKTSLSNSDRLVRFNTETKSFEPCNYAQAKQLFTAIPENWYAIMKNPAKDNEHPAIGQPNHLPKEMLTGQKINVRGPATFALFPGQMTKVIKGHSLRSNQYLLARVYEASAANSSKGEIRDSEGNLINTEGNYVNGQLLVIKGTEISFYIPPTGIEVVPLYMNGNHNKTYIRDAITLERLEYCILKDEDGNKRYVHGPAVVFPEPTETFVNSAKGSCIFRAVELSPITGIYVKVIADYRDEDGTEHKTGDELFITGNDQMIYYPRPEHAIINYDNRITHHAIAIPKGEGRYIMNRMTGEIKKVEGPSMYLPDPRTEVVVKRKLTERQCRLWFPNNETVLAHNQALTEKSVEKSLRKGADLDTFSFLASTSLETTLANLEANASISRGTSYTKPRTITLDNRFDGVVSLDVWTGYAVNVISKSGKREVVCGPRTILLEYDQTLEELQMSTGTPKNNDRLLNTVFLRHINNKVSDIITVETKDFVNCRIKVSYCVDFQQEHMDKWFNVENYVKFLCDRIRSDMKRTAKQYNIEEFYHNYSDIVRAVAIDTGCETDGEQGKQGRFFSENGMLVYDCEVLSMDIDTEIEEILTAHQQEMIVQSLKLADAEKRVIVAEKLSIAEKKEAELQNQKLLDRMELQRKEALSNIAIQAEVNRKKEIEAQAAKEAERDMQGIIDAIHAAEMARKDHEANQKFVAAQQMADLEKSRQEAYAKTVEQIMKSISPGLIEAMNSKSNKDLAKAVVESVGPYALAGAGETATDVANKLLRGTSLEDVVGGININI